MLKPLIFASLLLHLSFCWIAAPSAAHAQAAKPPVDPAARSAFEAGADAYDHGRFADALREFERAYQLSPTPKLLFNIGRAADGDGQSERAISAYNAYLQAFPKAENREFVLSRIAKLEASPNTPAPVAAPVPTAAAVSLAPADVAAADIAAQSSAPGLPAPADDGGKPPIWKRGWFWGVVGGAVVAIVTVAVVVAATSGGSSGGSNRGPAPNEHDLTLVGR